MTEIIFADLLALSAHARNRPPEDSVVLSRSHSKRNRLISLGNIETATFKTEAASRADSEVGSRFKDSMARSAAQSIFDGALIVIRSAFDAEPCARVACRRHRTPRYNCPTA